MTLKRLLFLCFSLCLLLSCLNSTEDECSTVICEGGPSILGFEILQDGENVFDIGTYSIDDVTIDDTNSQVVLESLSSINDLPALLIQDLDWTVGTFEYTVSLGDSDSFSIRSTFQLSDESECCGGIPFLSAIEINDVAVSLPITSGVFTVNL
ncbi:MAG: hypothetical protein ABJN84_06605 [Flavobacteriaceae bacterium]